MSNENITVSTVPYWEFKSQESFVDNWFLMSTPLPMSLIWTSYLAFVLKVGPEIMKKRSPFNLNNFLVFYNLVQVVFSAYIFYIGSKLLLSNGFLKTHCEVDKENVAWAIYVYFVAKTSEFLDTVFFVLRKRQRQISFLHVYHHSCMFLCSWLAVKYEPSQSTIFLGTINSFVHIVMYTYYGLSAFPEMSKYLWWKKYITSMQLIQFMLVMVHTTLSNLMSECRPSYIIITAIYANALLFLYLFSDFYIKSYIKNKNTNKIKTDTDINDNKPVKRVLGACSPVNTDVTNSKKVPEKSL